MTTKRVALVTGGNKGLGKQIVRDLAGLGMTVFLGSRDAQKGQAAAAELNADGLDVINVVLDVTDEVSVGFAAERVSKVAGRLDVLINNAGIHQGRPALQVGLEDMRNTYETNVFGLVTVTSRFLPLLKASDRPRIVNVASTTASHALTADPDTLFGQDDSSLAYASSKAAVTMLSLQYANAFRRQPDYGHIKVNSVTPGYIATDLNNFQGPRSVAQGARIVVALATIDDDGPNGGFFNDDGAVPW